MKSCYTYRSTPYLLLTYLLLGTFLLLQMVTNTDTHSKARERERERNTLLQMRCRHQVPPLRAKRTPWKKRQKENKSQWGWRTQGGQGSLSQLGKAHMNGSSEHRAYSGLPKSIGLRMYYSFQVSDFM